MVAVHLIHRVTSSVALITFGINKAGLLWLIVLTTVSLMIKSASFVHVQPSVPYN